MNNQQHRGVNFTLSSDLRKQKADPRANMALCVWETLEQRVIIPLAGGLLPSKENVNLHDRS